MRSSTPITFTIIVLAACVARTVAAAPMVCTGTACGAAAFPTAPAMCTPVAVSVAYKAGCGAITIHGGDVYNIADDLQCAAQHYGIVSSTNPGPVTANLFHVGTRDQFYPVRKNGLTSAAQVTSAQGVAFSASSTCPTLYTYITPVTNVSQGGTGGSVTGAAYFMTATTLVNDGIEVMALTVGPSTVVYIRDVGLRDRYYKTWSNGILTLDSLTSAMGYAIFSGISLETLATPKTSVTPARADCYTWFPGMTDTFYGTGVYPHDTMLCFALRHQHAMSGLYTYLCHETQHNVFYSSTMLGMTSTFKYDAGGLTAYSLAKDVGCTPLPANIARSRISIYSLATVNVWGYHYYRYDSDVAMAAFVQGHAIPWFPREVYIHQAGFFTNFYKGTYSDVTTIAAHGASQRAYFVSDSVTVPAASDIYPLRIRMYGTIGQTATGTGVYSESSDVTNICFHYLSCNLGFTYTVYALHIGSAGYYLYASTHRQLSTTYGGNTGGQIYLSYHSVAIGAITAEVNTPAIMKLLTRATTIVGTPPVIGVKYYRDTSDIARTAIHSGVLKGDANETIYVHRDTQQKVFYALTNNSITSTPLDSATALDTIRISPTATALTPYADSTLSTVRLAVKFACLWLPTAPLYGITYYPVGQDLLAAAIMEHYCRPTADHNDQFTIYVQYGFNMNRILGTTTPTLSTSAYYNAAAFPTYVINDVDSQPEGWTAVNSGLTSFPARLIYAGQLDTSVVYGTTPHFYWANKLSKSAFFAGVLNDVSKVVKVYYRLYAAAATNTIFIGSTHRGIRSVYLENPADAARVFFDLATPVPAITDDLYTLCFKEIHTAQGFDSVGTAWYDRSSNFGIAAFRETFINFRQCANLYVRSVGTLNFFLKSTQRGYPSDGYYQATATNAMVIRANAGDAYAAPTFGGATGVTIPFYHAVVRPWEVGKSVIVGGMNPFTHNTDATYGAYMNNILDPKETKTLYLHTTTRTYFPACTSRRVESSAQNTGGTTWGYVMSDAATRPAWMADTAMFKMLTTIEDYAVATPRACTGATVFRYDSDMSVCARIAGKGGMGDMFDITVVTVGTHSAFPSLNTNGLASGWSATAANAVLLDSGATPTFVAGTYTRSPDATGGSLFYISMRNTSLETGVASAACKGHLIYSIDCPIAAAVHHQGLAKIGEDVVVYGMNCGSQTMFYGTTQNGITSAPSCTAQVGYVLSLTLATITCTVANLDVSVPPYRPWGTAVGAGYFSGLTPLDVAAVEAGWITPGAAGAPVRLYAQTLTTASTQYLGSSTFFSVAATATCGFYISTSSGTTTAFSLASACYNAPVRLLDAVTACTGTGYGTIHYRWDTPVACAAAHMGLLTVGTTTVTTISVCKVTAYSTFIGSTSKGIRMTGSTTALAAPAGGFQAYTVQIAGVTTVPATNLYSLSMSVDLTGLETDLPSRYVFESKVPSGSDNIYWYRVAGSDLAAVLYRHGHLSETVRSVTLTVNVDKTTFTAPSFSLGIGEPVNYTAPINYTSTYTLHAGGGCTAVLLTGALTGTVYGTHFFSNDGTTNLAKAVVMAGVLKAGESGSVDICDAGSRQLYSSVTNMVASLPTAAAVASVCFGAGCTAVSPISVTLAFAHFISASCVANGPSMTRYDSCMNKAAYVGNVVAYATPVVVYLHEYTSAHVHCQRFYAVSRGGASTIYQANPADCVHLHTASTDAGWTATTIDTYIEHTLATTAPVGTYYYAPATSLNDMLEHQLRVSLLNPATFELNLIADRGYLPGSIQGGISSTQRWTNMGTATAVTIAFSNGAWPLEANIADLTQTPLWIGYLAFPAAANMVGVPTFVGPNSDMVIAGTASEVISWTFYQWPTNDAMVLTQFWVKAPVIGRRYLHAAWILGVQTTTVGNGGGTQEFVRILATYDTSAITPTSTSQTCFSYARVPAHAVQGTGVLHGTRWFSPPSDLTRAAIQEGRFVFADETSVKSRNVFICTNRVARGTTDFFSVSNNSIYSTETSAYTSAYIFGGDWGVYYDWPTTDNWVDRIYIKSALWVQGLVGGLDHFVRPDFDVAAALVARGDEDNFAYKAPLKIYHIGPTASTHSDVHISTCNAGLTKTYCGANVQTYFATTVGTDTIVASRYRAFYDSDLSPRYFYHTVPYPATNAPIAGGNTWDVMVYGSFNQYASKTSVCASGGTYRFLQSGSGTTTPWYYTDIKAAYWEARFSNFDETQYWIYVHNYGTQSRGYLGHNRYGMLTKGSEYYSEYNGGVWHNIFSFSSTNTNPGFSTAEQPIVLNSCEHMLSVVYGVGAHTGDSDPCGAAFLRNYLAFGASGTFYVRWYLNTYDMQFFPSAFSYGQWARPTRLRRRIYYTLSTVSGSQDATVSLTHTGDTGLVISVTGLQVVPSYQFSATTKTADGGTLPSTETTVYGSHYWFSFSSPVTDILLHSNQQRYLDSAFTVIVKAIDTYPSIHYPQARNGPWPSNYLVNTYGDIYYNPSLAKTYRHRPIQVYTPASYHTTGYTSGCTPLFPVSPNPLNCPLYVYGVGSVRYDSDISCAAWLAGKCPAWELCDVTLCPHNGARSLFHYYNKLGLLNLEANSATTIDAWWLTKAVAETNAVPAKKTDALFCINLNCTNRPTGQTPFPGYGSTYYQDETELCTAGVHFNVVNMDTTNVEICTSKVTNPPHGWWYSSSRRHVWTGGRQSSGSYTRGFVIGVAQSTAVVQPSLADGIEVCPQYVQSTTCPGSGGYHINCDLSIALYREAVVFFAECYKTHPLPVNPYAFAIQDQEGVGNRQYQTHPVSGTSVLHQLTERFQNLHTTDSYISYYSVPLHLPISAAPATVLVNPDNRQVCTATSDLTNCMLGMNFISNVSVGWRLIVRITYDGYGNYYPSRMNPTKTPTLTLTLTHSLTPSITPTQSTSITQTVSLSLTKPLTQTKTVPPTDTLTTTTTQTISRTPNPTMTRTVVPTPTATPTRTINPTKTRTVIPTPTPTPTRTIIPTFSPTVIATFSPTPTPTKLITPTHNPTPTRTVIPTPTHTFTRTIIPTFTRTVPATPTPTFSSTPTYSMSLSSTTTLSTTTTPSLSATASMTPSQSISTTQSLSMTTSLSPTYSTSASVTQSPSVTSSLSTTTSVSASQTASLSPTVSLSMSNTLSLSVSRSSSLSVSPSTTSTLSPTTTQSASTTQSHSTTTSLSPTDSMSASVTQSPSVTSSLSTTTSVSASQTASLSPTVTPSPTYTTSLSVSRSTSSSVSPSTTTSLSTTMSFSATQSVSTSASVSPSSSTTQSLSTTKSQSASQTASLSGTATPSTTASLSATFSVSASRTMSLSSTASLSTSVSSTGTRSTSASASLSQSASRSQSLTASHSVSTSASTSASATLSLTTSTSATASTSLSATASRSTSTSVSVSASRSLSATVSLSSTHSSTASSSLSLTASTSLTDTASLSSTTTHSLTSTVTLSATRSLSSSASLTPSTSVSHTSTTSLTPTTSLTTSHSHTATYTLSLTDSQSNTITLSITVTPPPTLTIPATPTISFEMTNTSTFSSSFSQSETPTPTYYPDLKTITFGNEIIFKNPVPDENGTIPGNSLQVITSSLIGDASSRVWFLFVVCMVSALCALVLLVLIAVALYRRYQQYKKEQNMRRRAARYIRRTKRRRKGPNGEDITCSDDDDGEYSHASEGEGHDDGTSDTLSSGHIVDFVQADGLAVVADDAQATKAGTDGYDNVLAIDASFKEEFARVDDPLGGKRAQRLAREGKGAKLETLNVNQFQRRGSEEDAHLMPTRKKENFVEEVLDPEMAQARARAGSIGSVLFNEINRVGGIPLAPSASINMPGLLRGASLAFNAPSSGADDSEQSMRENATTPADPAGRVGRYRRGIYYNDGSGPTEPKAQFNTERSEKKVNILPEASAAGAPDIVGAGTTTAVPLRPTTFRQLEDYKSFDFHGEEDLMGSVSPPLSPQPWADDGHEPRTFEDAAADDDERGAEPPVSADIPLTAAAATTAGVPVNVAQQAAGGLQALRLGDDMNDFDDFEAAEDYDFSILHGKSQPALDAEAILASKITRPNRALTTANFGVPVGGTAPAGSVGDTDSPATAGPNYFDANNNLDLDVDEIAAALGYGEDPAVGDAEAARADNPIENTQAPDADADGASSVDSYDFGMLVGEPSELPFDVHAPLRPLPRASQVQYQPIPDEELATYFDDVEMD